jgi:S-adenosylmethionine synthetase
MQISIRALDRPAAPVEMVERKGLGHPDTICDALAEEFSLLLSRFYLARCGRIQHHNVDKVLLRAGRSSPRLGGGSVDEPIEIFLAGRATTRFGGVQVPVDDLAHEACEGWLARHLRHLDVQRHVRVRCLVHPGSAELVELFGAGSAVALANDTSLGVSFAPHTPLERAVLAAERALNSAAARREQPALGEDVKVMGTRRGERCELTVAVALVDRHLPDRAAYRAAVEAARRIAGDAARALLPGELPVAVNAADDPARDRLYLTVTGTSAECGDDGQTGRGNRANGLITPYRPMTLESVAGKNPISHVGKLYNLAAAEVAEGLVAALPELASVEVYLVSRIGHPITDPPLVDVALAAREGRPVSELAPRVESFVRSAVADLDRLWERILAGRIGVVIA